MSPLHLSRRQLIRATAFAGGAVAIHFGSYSELGRSEWAFSNDGYTKSGWQTGVSQGFNPSNFNANTIADLALNAGMKYLVITSKHHEGFAWNMVRTG